MLLIKVIVPNQFKFEFITQLRINKAKTIFLWQWASKSMVPLYHVLKLIAIRKPFCYEIDIKYMYRNCFSSTLSSKLSVDGSSIL